MGFSDMNVTCGGTLEHFQACVALVGSPVPVGSHMLPNPTFGLELLSANPALVGGTVAFNNKFRSLNGY